MSDTELNQDELETIKSRLDTMGVKYHPSIGLDKAREKLKEALGTNEQSTEGVEETEGRRRRRLRNEAAKLVRVRITCMNPNKKEFPGEVFTVSNAVVGTHRKFVPFNSDEPYHVPHIIYEQMRDRQYQTFYTVRGKNGIPVRKGKLVKEFALEVLPDLTEEELKELARNQAVAATGEE